MNNTQSDNIFGRQQAERLHQHLNDGLDPNVISKMLIEEDPQGFDYGIGVVLDGENRPMETPNILIKGLVEGNVPMRAAVYQNSRAQHAELKNAVMEWQRIPNAYEEETFLATPSDAGTGAVTSAVQLARMIKPDLSELDVEAYSWPAYQAIGRSHGLQVTLRHLDSDMLNPSRTCLSIVQAGPHNSTGRLPTRTQLEAQARSLEPGSIVILDRAYPAFESACQLKHDGFDQVMMKSFQQQIQPFLECGLTTLLALSTTKAFRTFSLRPCGYLLVFEPNKFVYRDMHKYLNTLARARGSWFEHPMSRLLTTFMIDARGALEEVHQNTLTRVAECERAWRTQTRGGPLASLFESQFGGLFRSLPRTPDTVASCYANHLYPVFDDKNCRINITGLPNNTKAHHHISVLEGLAQT